MHLLLKLQWTASNKEVYRFFAGLRKLYGVILL